MTIKKHVLVLRLLEAGHFTRISFFIAAILFSFNALVSASDEVAIDEETRIREMGLPAVTNYTPQEYGGHPTNWAIVQDDRGVMYLGNIDGIYEYDGSTWRLIELPDQLAVRSMVKDDSGRIYVGSAGEFGYLDTDSIGQTIYVSMMDQIPEEHRDFGQVWFMHISSEGLYLNLHNKILLLSQGDTKVWESRTSYHVSALIDDVLYVREWETGLMKLEGDELVLLPGGERFASERIYSILPYDREKLLVGTVNDGLFIFDGNGFESFRTEADHIFDQYQLYLPGSVLPGGNFALATHGGCVIIDKQGRLINYIHRGTGLQDNSITYTYVGSDGALWLTSFKGLSRVETGSPFTHFGFVNGLGSGAAQSIRHNGHLYVGSNTGAFKFNPQTKKFELIRGIGIQCSGFDVVQGDLLAASYKGVQKIIDDRAEPVRLSVNRDYVAAGIRKSEYNPNRIFVTADDNGGTLYRTENGEYVDEGFIDQLDTINANSWVELKDGSLLLGTWNQGLVKVSFEGLDDGPSKLATSYTFYGTEQGLPDGRIRVFRIGGQDYLFTESDVFLFGEEGATISESGTFDEISDILKDTPFIKEDSQGRIWIFHEDGLILGKRGEDQTFEFDFETFKPLSDQSVFDVYAEENGIVWISTADGLIRYDENMRIDNDFQFPTLVRMVKTRRGEVVSAGLSPDDESTILPFADNSLTFEFSAMNYRRKNQTEYQTYLEGFDEDWSEWSHKTEKEYTNLKEGRYTFKVHARNVYGQKSETAAYSFVIKSPWYRTWLAILSYILLGGLLIWLIVRYRTRKLKQQRKMLERTVEERTREIQQRIEELSMINSVQEGLVAQMEMQGIYDLVGDKIRDMFNAQVVVIRTYDHEDKMEHYPYAFEKGERLMIKSRPFDAFSKHLIELQKVFIANKPDDQALIDLGIVNPKPVPGTKMPMSAVFMPLIVGEKVQGYISLQNLDRIFAFAESDVNLLSTLSNSMSVALENARLFDETNRLLKESEQRAHELGTVNDVTKALVSQLDLDALIQMVGDQMRNLFDANIVYLALLDKTDNMIHFRYQYGDDIDSIKLGEGLTSKIIKTGEAVLINKDMTSSVAKMGIARKGKEAASYLGVPIPSGGENIGVLSVQSTEQENRFDEDDRRLLATIARHVGVAIHNATLFDNTLKAQAEAEEAQKVAEEANEAKSAFLSTVSHELRTPLTSVIGFAKIIRKRLGEKIFPLVPVDDKKTARVMDQVAQNLDVVVSEGERLTTLINDVLDLAKIEAGKMEWHMENVEISAIIEQALAATSAVFESKNLKLKKQISKNLPVIQGDRDKLIQVLINLLSNAAKFTDEGSVTCGTEIMDKEIIISVSDTGMGISEEDQPKVFEKFKQVGDTLTDKPKGTGLGLPICKEIIEYHGGRIWVGSELGKGSTFYFSLPVEQESGRQRTFQIDDLVKQLKDQVFSAALNSGNGQQTILVADDEAHIRNLLRQELTESGYQVREAANGREALEEIRKEAPDLVILDVMMPEMNGFDVAAVLKNDPMTMDIPILILSIVQDKERGYRLGVDRYLTKPIDTDALFQEVGTLLGQGKSKKKVMIVDENASTMRTLAEVLETRGYNVVEANGVELVEKAVDSKPDIIILNSMLKENHDAVKTLRFEKGLENVLFLMYQ